MEQMICDEVRRFVLESPGNRFPESDARYFDEPLVGFAAADDPLFTSYKTIIGGFHLTPREIMEQSLDVPVRPATVICWALPVTRETRESNRRETEFPSRAWSQTRAFGEQLNAALRRHLVSHLAGLGCQAIAPQLSPAWKEFPDTPVGIASAWSERHAAYAAGLGTFSLNDALITDRGIAHRLGSVITDLALAPTPRTTPDYRHNCLWFREQSCGLCIGRCPVGAVSTEGHDKSLCRDYVYGTVPKAVSESYGVTQTGCGLCQTKVPCEAMVPPGRT